MPRFIIERTFPQPPTEEEIAAVGARVLAVNDQLGITWVKSYYSAKDGKSYCEYEAPNAEAIFEAARQAEIPADAVYPIDIVIDPAMFR